MKIINRRISRQIQWEWLKVRDHISSGLQTFAPRTFASPHPPPPQWKNVLTDICSCPQLKTQPGHLTPSPPTELISGTDICPPPVPSTQCLFSGEHLPPPPPSAYFRKGHYLLPLPPPPPTPTPQIHTGLKQRRKKSIYRFIFSRRTKR